MAVQDFGSSSSRNLAIFPYPAESGFGHNFGWSRAMLPDEAPPSIDILKYNSDLIKDNYEELSSSSAV